LTLARRYRAELLAQPADGASPSDRAATPSAAAAGAIPSGDGGGDAASAGAAAVGAVARHVWSDLCAELSAHRKQRRSALAARLAQRCVAREREMTAALARRGVSQRTAEAAMRAMQVCVTRARARMRGGRSAARQGVSRGEAQRARLRRAGGVGRGAWCLRVARDSQRDAG